ncbi:hypothetical protein [Hymenobacter sp.]|uniref:hypothetical protein n=1 Tax=Hymenobacter sp. TaxID=1898978 RepID=UPI00286C9AA9|nr:hypothetical protein [Hymenobacter sp.]
MPYTFWEKVMLQHAYVPKLVADCLGILLGALLLWTNHPLWAAAAVFGLSFLGSFLARNQDLPQLSTTPLGRWMLEQAKPVNLLVRTVGALVLSYGIWSHRMGYLILGMGLIVLARQIRLK